MIDRRLITNFDWLLLLAVMLLAACGVINLYSSASTFSTGGHSIFVLQIYWFGVGLLALLAVIVVGHHRLASAAYLLYGLMVLSLLAVLLWGRVAGGSQRWLSLGPVVVQPSEVARLVVIITLAHFFHAKNPQQPLKLRHLWLPMLLLAVPAMLIIKQPDLGTALMLLATGVSLVLINGVKLSSLVLAGGTLAGVLPVAFSFLKDYQKRRIFSFLNPESDPLGAAYHLIQSKIAVGSGGFWGKGFMLGTQSQLNFLPEQHTDFAFSVLAEEWGFVGSLVVLTLLSIVVFRCLMHALKAKDRLALLVVAGCTASIFWPAVINLGMVTGLFPVVGVPLPFISYGGSSMVSTMATVGLIQSVAMRRWVFMRT